MRTRHALDRIHLALRHLGFDLTDELVELLAELAARQKVDEEVEREIAEAERLDREQGQMVLAQVLVRVDGDDHRAHEHQEHDVDGQEHEGQVAGARVEARLLLAGGGWLVLVAAHFLWLLGDADEDDEAGGEHDGEGYEGVHAHVDELPDVLDEEGVGCVGARLAHYSGVEQRWVIAISKKNQLPTTLPIASILSSWHYQLK